VAIEIEFTPLVQSCGVGQWMFVLLLRIIGKFSGLRRDCKLQKCSWSLRTPKKPQANFFFSVRENIASNVCWAGWSFEES